MKSVWQSKSWWFSGVTAIAGLLAWLGQLIPGVEPVAVSLNHFLSENAAVIGTIWGGVAMILRLVTKDAVKLVD